MVKREPVDFSKGQYRRMLDWQRKSMFSGETVERYARWVGLTRGMIAVDIGCGLGFLGYTFWEYFGQGGHYIGVDIRHSLLREAGDSSRVWKQNGEASFIAGDVYRLPLSDNSSDMVMCQTLMIHLDKPELALGEMLRLLKPGGIIFCIEPDNFRPTLVPAFTSLPEHDVKTQMLLYRVNLLTNKGRMELGRGDNGIAPRIPHLLAKLGMGNIEVRTREEVSFLEPPYDSKGQREKIENMKKHWLNDDNFRDRLKQHREEFLAGGGDPVEFEKVVKIGEKQREIQLGQMERGEFYLCGAYPLYLIKGVKLR
ncbi:MAG: methyltransferase domain-containing protein [candidate division Zixibacteria bacterium]|nr:methyltransferase domain-containing protein [candidate division Zixibacteria bacterium]